MFRKYNWPGNVRELQNALEHALNFSDDNEIRREHLPIRILDSIYAPNIQAPEMTRQRFSLKDAIISAEHSMLAVSYTHLFMTIPKIAIPKIVPKILHPQGPRNGTRQIGVYDPAIRI